MQFTIIICIILKLIINLYGVRDWFFFLCNLLILDVEIEQVESEEMDRKEEGIYESIKEECIANQAENQGNNLTYMYVRTYVNVFNI